MENHRAGVGTLLMHSRSRNDLHRMRVMDMASIQKFFIHLHPVLLLVKIILTLVINLQRWLGAIVYVVHGSLNQLFYKCDLIQSIFKSVPCDGHCYHYTNEKQEREHVDCSHAATVLAKLRHCHICSILFTTSCKSLDPAHTQREEMT